MFSGYSPSTNPTCWAPRTRAASATRRSRSNRSSSRQSRVRTSTSSFSRSCARSRSSECTFGRPAGRPTGSSPSSCAEGVGSRTSSRGCLRSSDGTSSPRSSGAGARDSPAKRSAATIPWPTRTWLPCWCSAGGLLRPNGGRPVPAPRAGGSACSQKTVLPMERFQAHRGSDRPERAELLERSFDQPLGGSVPAEAGELEHKQERFPVPQEEFRVPPSDPDLVGLSDVRVHAIHRWDPSCVLVRSASVAEDREQVRVPLGKTQQPRERPEAHLERIDRAVRTNEVGDVRAGRPRGRPQVEPPLAGLGKRSPEALDEGRREFAAVGVPSSPRAGADRNDPLSIHLRRRTERLGSRNAPLALPNLMKPRGGSTPARANRGGQDDRS